MATYTFSRTTSQPEERLFSDQQTAKKYNGEMIQILSHVLKLMYQFNYKLDRNKHVASIYGWADEIITAIKRDKSSKGANSVMFKFLAYNGEEKLTQIIEKDFFQNYKFRRKITEDEFQDAVDYMADILRCNSKEEIVKYMDMKFPFAL